MTSATSYFTLLLLAAVVALSVLQLPSCVAGEPWSRSLPNGTMKGFPLVGHHLVVAQGQDHVLFAFDENHGNPVWNVSLHEELYPYLLALKASQSGSDDVSSDSANALPLRHILVFQGAQSMIGIDASFGDVLWRVGGLSQPTYLPISTDDHTTVLTAVFVNSSAPRCVTGFDSITSAVKFQHCDHAVFARTLTSGAPLPVVITERTFFGCFESTRDSDLSFVLELSIDDPAIRPHVFDFWPLTVMMTPTVQFVTHSDDDNGAAHLGAKRRSLADPGKPIRASFVVSAWDPVHGSYVGASVVYSVIAQAGIVDWKRPLPSAHSTPIARLVRRKPVMHQILATDDTSFLVALHSDTGGVAWNATINSTALVGHSSAPAKVNADTSMWPAATPAPSVVSLQPVKHLLQTDYHVMYSQPVQPPSFPSAASALTPTDVVVLVDIFSGRTLHTFDIYDTICTNLACHHDILYVPNNHEVLVLNVTALQMQTVYATGTPVFKLTEEEDNMRIVFGTEYSIFSFPLLGEV